MNEPLPARRGERTPAWTRPLPTMWHEPFRELESLWERMGQLFDADWPTERGGGWQPMVDVEETDNAYVFEVELPGVKRDDVNVEVRGNDLLISGEVKERERAGILRQRTRRTGSFSYRCTLPSAADTGKVEASLDDGVLTVSVAKAEKTKPKTIKVK